jgi:hypothetical protein
VCSGIVISRSVALASLDVKSTLVQTWEGELSVFGLPR